MRMRGCLVWCCGRVLQDGHVRGVMTSLAHSADRTNRVKYLQDEFNQLWESAAVCCTWSSVHRLVRRDLATSGIYLSTASSSRGTPETGDILGSPGSQVELSRYPASSPTSIHEYNHKCHCGVPIACSEFLPCSGVSGQSHAAIEVHTVTDGWP